MPEGIRNLPSQIGIHYIANRESIWLSIRKQNVVESPGGSIQVHRVKPLLNRKNTLGIGADQIIVPARTPYLEINFTPQGRLDPPQDRGPWKDHTARVKALFSGSLDYAYFLRLLADPKNFKGIRLIGGTTNFLLANFAVNNLGFQFGSEADKERAEQGCKIDDILIFATRKQLVSKTGEVLSLAERMAKRRKFPLQPQFQRILDGE